MALPGALPHLGVDNRWSTLGPRPTRRVSVENPVGQGPRALPQGNRMIPREPPVGAAVLGGPRPRNRDFSLRCHCEERSDAAIRIPLFLICRDTRGEAESSTPWLPLWGSCRRSRLIPKPVKKLEKLFIAPKVRQVLYETSQRVFTRCACAQRTGFLIKFFNQESV